MKRYFSIVLLFLVIATFCGCSDNNKLKFIKKYTDSISFESFGYTEEEAEKYIEDIPTADGGLLRIWYLPDDSGSICGKLLISNTSTSISQYDAEFDKKGRVIKEIDIEYTNPEMLNYREYNYKLFSSNVEIDLIYITGTTEFNCEIDHKMQSKDNTVSIKASYITDEKNIVRLDYAIVSENDSDGNTTEYVYEDDGIVNNIGK